MKPFTVTPPDLAAALADLLRRVPGGTVVTFGDLAGAVGARAAAVWAGTACRRPPDEWTEDRKNVPTWRAVRATGECVSAEQRDRLIAEGVPFDGDRVVLRDCRFDGLPSDGPLRELAEEQAALAERVSLRGERTVDRPIGAVDVAYPSTGVARAAYVEFEPDGKEPTFRLAVESPISFPYVSGFLAYRELPAYAALVARLVEANRSPAALLVDGNGVLHPRRCGVACGLGVRADVPTVGVAKKRLCGTVRDDGRIELAGETVGACLANPQIDNANPVFVSPGHRLSVDAAVRLAAGWFRDHRLPEPLWHADRLSKTG
ncbi:MAG: endonuclease V [Planctomycetota bacterium]